MDITQEQYDRVKHLLPKQRGNVEIDNLTFLRALHYMAENGCRWRAMPEKFGKWDTIYQRFRRWVQLGIFGRIEKELQSQAIDIKGMAHRRFRVDLARSVKTSYKPRSRAVYTKWLNVKLVKNAGCDLTFTD